MKKVIFNKKNILMYLIYIISIFWLEQRITNEIASTKVRLVLYGLIFLSTIAMFFLLYILKKEYSEHKTFFIIGLTFGLLYMIFIPAIQGATDELPHFLRTYQISSGDLVIKNADENNTDIPEELYNFSRYLVSLNVRYSKDNLLKKVDYNKTVKLDNVDVATGNSPILYLPQIIGMEISKIFNFSPLFTLMTVRFINFITWLLLMTQAIKIMPIHKKALGIFFTAPAVLSLVSTTNMDALPLSTIVLFFAYVLNYKYTKNKIEKKDKIILIALSILFSTYKLFYPVLLTLLFLIPKECYKSKKEKYIFTFGTLIIALTIDFVWYVMSMSVSSIIGENLGAEQLELILKKPIYFGYVVLNTYFTNAFYYISNLFSGTEMCYQYARIPSIFVLAYMCLFIYVFLNNEKNNIKLNKKEVGLILSIFLIIIILTSISLYIGWTVNLAGVGTDEILGIQSRYYFSLVPLILLLIKTKKNNINQNVYKYIIMLNSIILIITITSVIIGIMKLV